MNRFTILVLTAGWLFLLAGCGTTRWSDTARTGTEQLLVSTAIDRAVDNIDFSPLAGKDVYFDEQYLKGIMGPPPVPGAAPGPRSDDNYLASTLRQHLLAAGVALKADRKEATYIVEARSGVIGTNRHDVMLGVPSINLPFMGILGMPSAIPEIPLAKTTDQKGVAKIALCSFNQKTGEAVWQSGSFPVVATAKDSWILGAGPWQRGTIYDGSRFAGNRLIFSSDAQESQHMRRRLPVTAEAVFAEHDAAVEPSQAMNATGVVLATATQAAPAVTANSAPHSNPADLNKTTEKVAASAPAASPPVAAPDQAAAHHAHADTPPAVKILRLPAVDRQFYGDSPFIVASDELDEEEKASHRPSSEHQHRPAGPDDEPAPFRPDGLPRLLEPERWFGAPDD